MTEDQTTNYFESFIFPNPNRIKPTLPTISHDKELEINDDDTDIVYLQKLCKTLNCKPFEPKYYDLFQHHKELIEFLQEYNKAITKFGYELDLADISNVGELNQQDCDQLEIEVERLYPIYCKMELALKTDLNEMKRDIERLENKKEIQNFEKYEKEYEKLKSKEFSSVLQKTRAFQNFKNRKIVKVLEEAILNREIDNDPLKIALQEIVKKKKMTLDELQAFMETEKLETLKLVFLLKNKKFVSFDQENEIITPWTSNF